MSRPPIPGLKEGITTAAREVFAAKGYRGTTVREIAQLVGVTVGVIYAYFKNKESLYLAALQEEMTLYQSRVRTLEEEDHEQAIRRYVEHHLEYTLRRREGISLQFKDYDLDFAKPYRREFFAFQRGVLATIIRKGVEKGTWHVTSCDDAALFILYVLKGAVFNELAGTVEIATRGNTLSSSILNYLRQESRKEAGNCTPNPALAVQDQAFLSIVTPPSTGDTIKVAKV